MSGVQVFIDDLNNHPSCIHGPTLIFARHKNKKRYFACSACRDRKDCPFFLWEDELSKINDEKKKIWEEKRLEYIKQQQCHRKLFIKLHKIKQCQFTKRFYCHDCNELFLETDSEKHKEHDVVNNISDENLGNPSKLLKLRTNAKKEAQYLFSESSVKVLINAFDNLNLKHIICMGAPRIHEYVQNNLLDQGYTSLLLDIDERYRHFFGPLQFCWYNMFNNYFFEGKLSKNIFEEFLKTNDGNGIVVVTDPPFGGRIEPLADTMQKISKEYQTLNHIKKELPIVWIFPYFMEPQILNSFPTYTMLDYKVDYENHPLFTEQLTGRKYGSPVRIFTNIAASDFVLPEEEGYHFCSKCNKWISQENKHCAKCNECTSKNGTTYVHCDDCKRCVKPSWKHCLQCNRCCVQDHKCGDIEFSQNCFHCKLAGHKKRECPNLNVKLSRKRKQNDNLKKNRKQARIKR